MVCEGLGRSWRTHSYNKANKAWDDQSERRKISERAAGGGAVDSGQWNGRKGPM